MNATLELIQVASLIICLFGVGVVARIIKSLPQISGWLVLPMSIFLVNAAFYAATIVVDLPDKQIDLYLLLGAIRTLYTLIILALSLLVMWNETRR